MKLAVTGTTAERVGRLAAFADSWRYEVWPFDRSRDFCSFLIGQPDVAGVLVADDAIEACEMVVGWRVADLQAPILVLLADRRHGPTDLASLLMAGADDAQHLSSDPQEIAARLFSLTRRRRVAEPAIGASAVLLSIACQAGNALQPTSITPELKRA